LTDCYEVALTYINKTNIYDEVYIRQNRPPVDKRRISKFTINPKKYKLVSKF